MKIVDYRTIEVSNHLDNFDLEIKKAIVLGYQPYGNPSHVYTPEPYDSWTFTQAVVKYEEEK